MKTVNTARFKKLRDAKAAVKTNDFSKGETPNTKGWELARYEVRNVVIKP